MKRTPARERLEAALARIADPNGEGARTCLSVYADTAKKEADAADARARDGKTLGALDGAIVTLKDLFDVAGEVTRAASKVLFSEGKVAAKDALVVQRLRAAGAVIVGKTNMTEFAFSGVGMNPHFGTPGNPFDRARIPGGSTSGGGVAVADGMCEIAVGTDTGGSCRIPAALCGIVGFKPTKARVPLDGAFPLSVSFDSVGWMAKTVAECWDTDAVATGSKPGALAPEALAGLRVGVAQGLPLDKLDDTVSKSFAAAIAVLQKAGVQLSDKPLPLVDEMIKMGTKGGIPPYEAFAQHRDRIAERGAEIDPNVRTRIERASTISAADYAEMVETRTGLIQKMDVQLADLDVLVMPTTPIVAPLIADLIPAEAFSRANTLLLRNPSIWNFFDTCAISLPLPRNGGLSTGLMLVARNGGDLRLLRIAAAFERLLSS